MHNVRLLLFHLFVEFSWVRTGSQSIFLLSVGFVLVSFLFVFKFLVLRFAIVLSQEHSLVFNASASTLITFNVCSLYLLVHSSMLIYSFVFFICIIL